MYGREPKIPIDIELNLPSHKEEVTPKTYMERLVHKMDWAFRKTRENIDKDKASRKKYHDKTIRLSPCGGRRLGAFEGQKVEVQLQNCR